MLNLHHPNHQQPQQRDPQFYVSYKRRTPDESTIPAIADLQLHYVRIHSSSMIPLPQYQQQQEQHDGCLPPAQHKAGQRTGSVGLFSCKCEGAAS